MRASRPSLLVSEGEMGQRQPSELKDEAAVRSARKESESALTAKATRLSSWDPPAVAQGPSAFAIASENRSQLTTETKP